MKFETGKKYDVTALTFTGWTSAPGGETAHDGYNVYDYFDVDGTYLGADEFGVEPTGN